MKRMVALAVAAAGAAVVAGQRWQARQAERALWSEITDPAPRDQNAAMIQPAVPADESGYVRQ